MRGDSVRIDHEYVYALSGNRESGTQGLLVTRRTMHVVLAGDPRFSTYVRVEVTGSARYDSNLVPADLGQAALTAHEPFAIKSPPGW